MSPEYIAARQASYQSGSTTPGKVGVSSYYTNDNSRFLGQTVTGVRIEQALPTLKVGERVEITTGGRAIAAFGRTGVTQYVSSSAQNAEMRQTIIDSGTSDFGGAIREVIGVPQVPDRMLEVTLEVPEGDLQLSYFGNSSANSQNMTGGLPVFTLPDGTRGAMYEGTITSINFLSPEFQSQYPGYKLSFNNYDPTTGKLMQSGTYIWEDGKLYLVRTK